MTAKRYRGIKKFARRLQRETRKARVRESGRHDRCSPVAEFSADVCRELDGVRACIEHDLVREFYAPVEFTLPTLHLRITLPEGP